MTHSNEVFYVYGLELAIGTASQKNTSLQMMDYWTSFATSLTPNDGHGSVPRMYLASFRISRSQADTNDILFRYSLAAVQPKEAG